eukprot:10158279-Ditylum_brightwellii.AAC.1
MSYPCFRQLGQASGLTSDTSSVLLEPKGVSDRFIRARPLDVVTEGDEGFMVLDVTIAPNPKLTQTMHDQINENRDNLH